MRVGIVGLGVMGGATGRHLIDAGFEVHGHDVDSAARNRFAALGGLVADDLHGLAESSDVIITWLPTAEDLVQTGEVVASAAAAGAVLIEMGTLPLEIKRSVRDRLAASGIDMIDAPVSGTGQQAEDATLVVLASGERTAFDRVEAVFAPMGTVEYLGPFGHGSVMKYIANLLVTVHTVAAAEAHALAAASGVDAQLVQRVIASGVATSRMWDIRGAMMANDSYEPPAGRLDIIKKDAGIIAEYAEQVHSPAPLLTLSLELFRDASEAGLGSLDAAAIRRHLDSL
jgi:3-hydroxyisobutyrate dehydrogenase-like beta-hydroxyacid dehydrogenase